MIKIWFTKDPDNYKFTDKNKIELIFFDTNEETGFWFSYTNFKKKKLEFYDYINDSMVEGSGYKRRSYKYTLVKSWKFLRNDSTLTKVFR